MNPQLPCLPIDNGYPLMTTNKFCSNGWGWLKEGECGCQPGSAGHIPDKKGCSIRCTGQGPNACPNCPQDKTMMYIGIGAAALAAFFLLGRK